MSLTDPKQEEIDEVFDEYHSLLVNLSKAYRSVNTMERKLASIFGANWETSYEDYKERKDISPLEWY